MTNDHDDDEEYGCGYCRDGGELDKFGVCPACDAVWEDG